MDEIYRFVSDWWIVAVIALPASCGMGAMAGEASEALRTWLWGPPPKPRRYRVTVEDPDGWPIRSYKLPSQDVGRLLREIEHDKPA